MDDDHRSVKLVHCRAHLTDRQAEVLRLAAAGLPASQIAQRLSITRRTVEDHLHAMRQRTNTHSGVELVALAFTTGVLVPGSWPPSLSDQRCMSAEIVQPGMDRS